MFIKPTIFNPQHIIAAQSDRLGGISQAPFVSLNLGLSVNDREEDVVENRRLFFSSLGISAEQTSRVHQVHGAEVHVAEYPGLTHGFDAQITNKKGLYLLVSIADCTPILIHDEQNGVVAGIHAGWRGTAAGIVGNTLKKMESLYGSKGEFCKAFIGACISYANFEVGEEVAEHFAPLFKRFDTSRQKWFVDLKAANSHQLQQFGIPANNIEISHWCTVEHNDRFFSHRHEKGQTGRMMAVIGLSSEK